MKVSKLILKTEETIFPNPVLIDRLAEKQRHKKRRDYANQPRRKKAKLTLEEQEKKKHIQEIYAEQAQTQREYKKKLPEIRKIAIKILTEIHPEHYYKRL